MKLPPHNLAPAEFPAAALGEPLLRVSVRKYNIGHLSIDFQFSSLIQTKNYKAVQDF